jgi:hypothetical protein
MELFGARVIGGRNPPEYGWNGVDHDRHFVKLHACKMVRTPAPGTHVLAIGSAYGKPSGCWGTFPRSAGITNAIVLSPPAKNSRTPEN